MAQPGQLDLARAAGTVCKQARHPVDRAESDADDGEDAEFRASGLGLCGGGDCSGAREGHYTARDIGLDIPLSSAGAWGLGIAVLLLASLPLCGSILERRHAPERRAENLAGGSEARGAAVVEAVRGENLRFSGLGGLLCCFNG